MSLTATKALPPRTAPRPAARWGMCALLLSMTADNYMNRQALSVLAPALIGVLAWSPLDYAAIVFWFQLGYAAGFIPGGWLFDRLGTRRGFIVIMLALSLAAAGHAVAGSVGGFMAARFCLGLAGPGHMPGGIKVVAEWFPAEERALATGIFKCGSNLGAVLAPMMVPVLYLVCGWRGTFLVLGGMGVVWLAAWIWFNARWQPERGREGAGPGVPLGILLRQRETWGYVVVKFMTDAIWHWYLAMLPLFLSRRFGLGVEEFGLPLVTVYIIAAGGSVGAGWLSMYWMRRGWPVTRARKQAMLICCLATVPVMLVAHTQELWLVVALVGVAHAAHQGLTSNLFAAVADIFPQKAVGMVVGLGGMAGQLGAALMTLVSGMMLAQEDGLTGLFFVAGSVYVAAFLVFHVAVPKLEPLRWRQ